MATIKQPIRIQLSRRAGFNLQRASRALNELPAVNCARPSQWGNPCRVTGSITAREAVIEFEGYASSILKCDPRWLDPLRGHNLACWCNPAQPHCHVDTLLRLANRVKN